MLAPNQVFMGFTNSKFYLEFYFLELNGLRNACKPHRKRRKEPQRPCDETPRKSLHPQGLKVDGSQEELLHTDILGPCYLRLLFPLEVLPFLFPYQEF